MPEPLDVEALAERLGVELAAAVQPQLDRLKADTEAAVKAASVQSAFIERDGCLVLVKGDGQTQNLGVVVGRDGAAGKPGFDGKDGKDGVDGKDAVAGRDGLDGAAGRDGFGFDDLDASLHSDGRTIVLSFTRGDTVHSFELPIPAMIYRGVFAEGRTYHPGDVVTFGGSGWVANATTTAKPGDLEKTWTLAIKRGRDGKDFAGLQIKAGA